jgi:hypothetical protein
MLKISFIALAVLISFYVGIVVNENGNKRLVPPKPGTRKTGITAAKTPNPKSPRRVPEVATPNIPNTSPVVSAPFDSFKTRSLAMQAPQYVQLDEVAESQKSADRTTAHHKYANGRETVLRLGETYFVMGFLACRLPLSRDEPAFDELKQCYEKGDIQSLEQMWAKRRFCLIFEPTPVILKDFIRTPKGEVKALVVGSTREDSRWLAHPDDVNPFIEPEEAREQRDTQRAAIAEHLRRQRVNFWAEQFARAFQEELLTFEAMNDAYWAMLHRMGPDEISRLANAYRPDERLIGRAQCGVQLGNGFFCTNLVEYPGAIRCWDHRGR